MLLNLPDVLTAEQVRYCREQLARAEWVDGRVTAGHQSAKAKHNMQVPEDSPIALELSQLISQVLRQDPLFMSAAIPLEIFPPLFNSYSGGQSFGTHIDSAIRPNHATGRSIRTDLSATLFLAEPDEYDGGELTIEDNFGVKTAKLPAGHMILYPASSLHHVKPVTRGARVAAFLWIQSMVRDDGQRTLLFDLDTAIQKLNRDLPDHGALVQLTGVYNNLIRRWGDV